LNAPDLSSLPGIVLDGNEPVFSEPWQAQAFALVIGLHETGLFDWTEWATALSQQLANAENDSADNYYNHWLSALESLIADKGLTTSEAINAREQEWHDAAARTPHGEPILLTIKPVETDSRA